MVVANVTTTVTVSGATTTLTGSTHTVTAQAQPFLLFGLPPELLALFTLAVVGIVYLFFRFQVKGVPVIVEWLRKNYSAVQFRAQEDLGGIFLYVLNARGKRAETIKKTGLPFEVKIVNNRMMAYLLTDGKGGHDLTGAEKEALRLKGWTLTDRSEKSTVGFIRKREIERKAYLIEKKDPAEQLAYIDFSGGGQKVFRKYTAVEGSGHTLQLLDMKAKIDAPGDVQSKDSSGLMHEVRSAAKGFLALVAEAMQGTMKSLVLPLVAGIGLGVTIMVLIITLTGGKL